MVFPIVGGNQSTGDFITNSLRLNDDDSPSLSLDLSSPNTDKFTLSMWVKRTGARTQLGSLGKRLTGEAGDNRSIDIEQGSTGRLGISAYNGVADSNVAAYNSNTGEGPLLRDTSAWYHFVYAFDTGQGTAGNRFKWYINGVLQSGYNTTTTPSQNADLFDSSGSIIRIGKAINNESRFGDMYIAQYYYVDGQQYDHTYFGEFNDNGVWVPVENGKGAGGAITFGTNGFYLEFKQTGTSANASGIGADTSGNGKHLTPANLAAIDITTDTPQNNFATLNPLDTRQGATFSEGNTKIVTSSGNRNYVISTIGVSSGKWYCEAKITGGADNHYSWFGTADFDDLLTNSASTLGDNSNEVGFNAEGGYQKNNSNTSGFAGDIDNNDIVGIALDLDNNRITHHLNGQYANGSGSYNQSSPSSYVSFTNSTMGFAFGDGAGADTATFLVNFGNAPFSISSGNADANGYGNFEYAVPSGYYSLCTKNLAEFG
jgi:hypothetical protein